MHFDVSRQRAHYCFAPTNRPGKSSQFHNLNILKNVRIPIRIFGVMGVAPKEVDVAPPAATNAPLIANPLVGDRTAHRPPRLLCATARQNAGLFLKPLVRILTLGKIEEWTR
jgi:hypothetical protein